MCVCVCVCVCESARLATNKWRSWRVHSVCLALLVGLSECRCSGQYRAQRRHLDDTSCNAHLMNHLPVSVIIFDVSVLTAMCVYVCIVAMTTLKHFWHSCLRVHMCV